LKSFVPLDEKIIRANVAHILENPNKLYDHARGKLDAVAVIELAISERLDTIKAHRAISGRKLSPSSRELVAKLRREAGLMAEAIRRLQALGITTASPLAAQLRRERENPLPTMRELLAPAIKLFPSGRHQRQAAALLNPEKSLPGVDAGKVRPELLKIAVVTRLTKETLNLSLTVGWGHAGQNGVTMPGKGKIETRGYTADELAVAAVGRPPQTSTGSVTGGLPSAATPLLGAATHDIFLNDSACWRNVPEKVWDYTIGGYQVMKKWLSYREFGLLGRPLTPDEAREVTHMARRIAALILLQPALDQNYLAAKNHAAAWPA
jgi:hypothetical protein